MLSFGQTSGNKKAPTEAEYRKHKSPVTLATDNAYLVLCRRPESALSGIIGAVAKTNAPAEAAKTEAFSADLTPVPAVIPIAKANKSHPAKIAARRVLHPRSRAMASVDSAIVTIQASVGITMAGNHGFSFPA